MTSILCLFRNPKRAWTTWLSVSGSLSYAEKVKIFLSLIGPKFGVDYRFKKKCKIPIIIYKLKFNIFDRYIKKNINLEEK